MSDFDRFTEFLRREARGYHEPPEVPAEVIWRGVEGRMAGVVGGSAGAQGGGTRREGGAVDHEAIDALGYNVAPATPREEMWKRIEAGWAMRESVGEGGVVGGERVGRMAAAGVVVKRITAPWQWSRRRRVVGWAAGLAAAASLVLGIALGRDLGPPQPGKVGTVGTEVEAQRVRRPDATLAAPPSESTAPSVTVADRAGPDATAEPEPEVAAAGVLPLMAERRVPQGTAALGEPESQGVRSAEAALVERTEALPRRLTPRRDHETIRYLGRAETLLTAFRTDQRTLLTERDLASWGRELLIETRMRLDLPVARTPEEFALLEDLELVLLQISRLGSGAPDVEWQLARESMEVKSALPRVRAATTTDGL